MTPDQIEWCQTLNGNCIQCKHQEDCEMCLLHDEKKKDKYIKKISEASDK